jgi:ribonuclease HI
MALNIIQINIRSIFKNLSELKNLVNTEKIDIAMLQETMIGQKTPPHIHGYKLAYMKKHNCHRGVGILVNEKIPHKQVKMPKLSKIETTAITINYKDEDMILISCYMPHGATDKAIEKDMADILVIADRYKYSIVGGDWNAKNTSWGSLENCSRGKVLGDLVEASQMGLLNNGAATRITKPTEKKSAIDVTIVSRNLMSKSMWYVTSDNLGSDHKLISITIDDFSIKVNNKRKYVNKKLMTTEINAIQTQQIQTVADFFDKMEEIKKKCTYTKKHKTTSKRYWTEDIQKLWDQRKDELKEFGLTKKLKHYNNFCELQKQINRLIAKTSKKNKTEMVLNINPETPLNMLWNKVHFISGKPRRETYNHVLNNEDNATKFLDKMTEKPIYIQRLERDEDQVKNFTLQEMEKYLKTKDANSAAGYDGITYGTIKQTNENFRMLILRIMNYYWQIGDLPEEWKTSKIMPIAKPQKDIYNINSYRPIALATVFSKILNGLVKERLTKALEKRNSIPQMSMGFKKGEGATNCANYIVNMATKNKRNGKTTVFCFIDLSQAFDNVNIYLLWTAMNKLQVPEELSTYNKNILTNRRLIIETDDFTIKGTTHQGLPQGCVLSPTNFLIYTAEFHDLTNNHTTLVQYADDFVLVTTGDNTEDAMEKLQNSLNQFSEKADKLELKINEDKCAIMIIGKQKTKKIATIGTTKLTIAENYKYLGIHIDRKLNFGKHINELRDNLQKRINLMKYVSGIKWGGHPKVLGTLYKTIIRSKMEYGSTVYMNAAKTHLQKLQTIQNSALRLIGGFTKSTPIHAMEAITSIQNPEQRREWTAKKETTRNIFYNNPLGQQLKEVMNEQHDREVKYSYIEKIAQNTKHILEALDDEESKQHSGTGKLEIQTAIRGIAQPKINYDKQTLKLATISEINTIQADHTYYTDGSIMNGQVGYGVYCKETNIEKHYKIDKNVAIYAAELTAIETAAELISRTTISKVLILTDSLTACHILKKTQQGDKTNKQAKRIINTTKKTNKNIIIKWIPAHVGIDGNERADELAKSGTTSGELSNYKLQLRDAYTILERENQQRWREAFTTKSEEKGKDYFSIVNQLEETPWYNNIKLTSRATRTINRVLTNHAYTPSWLARMKVQEKGKCEQCNVEDDVHHILYKCPRFDQHRQQYTTLVNQTSLKTIYENKDADSMLQIIYFLNKTKLNI